MQVLQYQIMGRLTEALQVGIRGLALLNISLSANPSWLALFKENILLKYRLRKRLISDLIKLPVMTHPDKKLEIKILMQLFTVAYIIANYLLLSLITLKMVNLSLQYGNNPESAYAYMTYGLVLTAYLGEFKKGYEFSQLSLQLNEKFGNARLKCTLLFLYGGFIHPWSYHQKSILDYLNRYLSNMFSLKRASQLGLADKLIFKSAKPRIPT